MAGNGQARVEQSSCASFQSLLVEALTEFQSGLLAAVAAQLLGTFKDVKSSSGAKDFLVAMCHLSLFLNINATIGSFVLIDNLGEVGYEAAKREAGGESRISHLSRLQNPYNGSVSQVLEVYGASKHWKAMLFHCR